MFWRTIILLWFCTPLLAASPLLLSEFSAGGRQGLLDEDGDTPDWIEIQNISSEPIDLAGWSLSDNNGDGSQARPWPFPATNLAPGKFMVVFASGKNRQQPGAPLHTNFRLNANRGDIVLQHRADISAITNYPPQVVGVSFGVTPSNTADRSTPTHAYLSVPTPGAENATPVFLGPHISPSNEPPFSPALPTNRSPSPHASAQPTTNSRM